MNHPNKTERLALAAMAVTAVVSLVVAAQGYVGLAFLLFAAAATPLPLLASIRARRARDMDPEPRRHDEARYRARER